MAEALEAIVQQSFPSLAPHERMTAGYFRYMMEVFPEGQHALLNERGEPVACSVDILSEVDFGDIQHTCSQVSRGLWPRRQIGNKEWLYGLDMCVHPDYRGLGLSKMLYQTRHTLIKQLNLRGHVAGGLLSGYGRFRQRMPAQRYLDKVVRGEIFDPTVSVQIRRGFKVQGLLEDYVDDPRCDNKAALIVWQNLQYARGVRV